MMNRKRHQEEGFTLIEMLAVLTLVAFVLVMLAPNIINSMKSGQLKAAQSQVNSIKGVLNSYYLDNGCFPTTQQGLSALIDKPSVPPVPENWNGPYFEDRKLPKDPWNHELKYVCPGVHNPDKYDLYSWGQDGAEGGSGNNADIGNW